MISLPGAGEATAANLFITIVKNKEKHRNLSFISQPNIKLFDIFLRRCR